MRMCRPISGERSSEPKPSVHQQEPQASQNGTLVRPSVTAVTGVFCAKLPVQECQTGELQTGADDLPHSARTSSFWRSESEYVWMGRRGLQF